MSLPSDRDPAELGTIAERMGATLLFLRVGGGDVMTFAIRGAPRVVEIDVGACSMRELLDVVASLVATSTTSNEWIDLVARDLNERGKASREDGRYLDAVLCYRFALAVVSTLGVWDRTELLTRNLQYVRASLDHLLRVNVAPPGPDGPSLTTFPVTGGQFLQPAGHEDAGDRQLRDLLAVVRDDASELADRIAALSIVGDRDSTVGLTSLAIRCRLAGLASAEDSGALLIELSHRAATFGRRDVVLYAVLERLAAVTVLDILGDSVDITTYEAGSGVTAFAEPKGDFPIVWELFLRERAQVDEIVEIGNLVWRYWFAYAQLQHLRWKVTCAGGPLAHRLSYRISGYLHVLGRDYVHLLDRRGLSNEAFGLAEQLHGRSMVDWMSRSHHTTRLVRDRRLTGSVQAVMPASESEIRDITERLDTPLLVYLDTGRGYDVWLLRPGGELITARIDDPSSLIREQLLTHLSYGTSTEAPPPPWRGPREVLPNVALGSSSTLPDDCLEELYEAIIPVEVSEALRDGGTRLTVIADSILDYVPFCALRDRDGRYLVERLELAYWPSVTAWMLTQSAQEVRARSGDLLREQYRPDRFTIAPDALPASSPAAVVVGDPEFASAYTYLQNGEPRTVPLSRLPGARREATEVAKLLGGTELMQAEASVANVIDRVNVIPILHLATHGLVVADHPEESFIALSDGALTARFLYESDRPMIVELVVMSACQTALGGSHPDSLIGLTNAFLVAGANTVVSTLWSIHDEVTVDLITRFYHALTGGDSVPAAMRSAQLHLLGDPRHSSPYFWAAFKVTGNGSNPLRTLGRI